MFLKGFLSCQLPSLLAGNCPIGELASGFQRISSINTPRDRSNTEVAATGTRIITGGSQDSGHLWEQEGPGERRRTQRQLCPCDC